MLSKLSNTSLPTGPHSFTIRLITFLPTAPSPTVPLSSVLNPTSRPS